MTASARSLTRLPVKAAVSKGDNPELLYRELLFRAAPLLFVRFFAAFVRYALTDARVCDIIMARKQFAAEIIAFCTNR